MLENSLFGAPVHRVGIKIAMGKQAAKRHRALTCHGRRDVKKVMKDMPFSDKPESPGRLPRDMKSKQREWLISGLKRMGAPMVLWRIACYAYWGMVASNTCMEMYFISI